MGSKSDRVLVGLVPMGLAVPGDRDGLPRSVADDPHERLAELALEMQQAAGHAEFWEMGAAGRGGTADGSVYALAGQMASVGEQIALAHAAAVEVALWRDHRETAEDDAADEMRMRAMAEAQCLFVVGAGHASANLAVRALAVNAALRRKLISEFTRGRSVPTFAPFSEAPRDWVSLSGATCRKLQAVAQSAGHDEVAQLVEAVAEFGLSPSWRALTERRGKDFHRWRPQTYGIEGVSHASPWTIGPKSRSLSVSRRSYEEAKGLADETARLATEAMLKLAAAMRAFMDRWLTASPHLGGPKFRIADGSPDG